MTKQTKVYIRISIDNIDYKYLVDGIPYRLPGSKRKLAITHSDEVTRHSHVYVLSDLETGFAFCTASTLKDLKESAKLQLNHHDGDEGIAKQLSKLNYVPLDTLSEYVVNKE